MLARATLCVALAIASCGAPPRTESRAEPRDEPIVDSVPAPANAMMEPVVLEAALRSGTVLEITETRRVEGEPERSSRYEVRWSAIDEQGRAESGEVRVLEDRRIGETGPLSTDLEGATFTIRFEGGRIRLLEGEEPHLRDVTFRRPDLAAMLISPSGRSHLLPPHPVRPGESWSIPLHRFLEATQIVSPGTVGGEVTAQLLAADDEQARIAYRVHLENLPGEGPEIVIRFTGEASIDFGLGIPVRSSARGEIVEGERRLGFEAGTSTEIVESR